MLSIWLLIGLAISARHFCKRSQDCIKSVKGNASKIEERSIIHSLEVELAHFRSELTMAILSSRTRAMMNSLKDVDQRMTATQGLVELLERCGNANGTADSVVGICDGLGMIGAGVIGIVQGALCMLFPFMAGRSTESADKRERKKTKKTSRASANYPSPVPEERPTGLDLASRIQSE